LEAEKEGDTGTLSPDQREKKHDQKYEAEFVVVLNMTKAFETGTKMGIVINRNADFEEATVWKVQKFGLIEEWTKANPGKDVHPGDQLVRVNDIQWHANTEIFMQRIRGQFEAGRHRVDGASEILRLYIQRPRTWHHKRFALQREDLHNELYAAEFVAELPLHADVSQTTMDNAMGWTLNTTNAWEPVTIQKIEQHGHLAEWNQLHNDSLILEGDEIIKVGKVIWHNNATAFITNIEKQIKAAQAPKATNKSIILAIRRPRAVQEAFDEAHPFEELESCKMVKNSIKFTFQEKEEDRPLAWKLTPGAKSETGVEGPVLIEKIWGPVGLVARWNTVHIGRKIEAGDKIVTLNGVSWDKYGSAKEFSDAVQNVLSTFSNAGTSGEPVRLVLERPVCGTRNHRLNMEHGVHMENDVSQVTTTSFAEDRSDVAEEPGAKGNSGDMTAMRVAFHQTVRKSEVTPKKSGVKTEDGKYTSSSEKALKVTSSSEAPKSKTLEGDALTKARVAEIDATLKTLEPLKDPKVVALVVEFKKERDDLRAKLSKKELARIAEIETVLKTLEPLKDSKVVALVLELKKERDGLRTKVGAKDSVEGGATDGGKSSVVLANVAGTADNGKAGDEQGADTKGADDKEDSGDVAGGGEDEEGAGEDDEEDSGDVAGGR